MPDDAVFSLYAQYPQKQLREAFLAEGFLVDKLIYIKPWQKSTFFGPDGSVSVLLSTIYPHYPHNPQDNFEAGSPFGPKSACSHFPLFMLY